jgi:Uncharacterised nucleotidyltransferase
MAARRAFLTPEEQLLLLTAATSPSDAAARHVMDDGLDVEALCALADRENATPLVLRQLRRVDPSASDPGYGELRAHATARVMHLMHLEQLLHHTLEDLAGHGIEALLLKGAGLAYTAYPAFADRPMSDLDLMVRPESAVRAWEALQLTGWTWPADRWDQRLYATHHHRPPLVQEPGGFRLEIHDDLFAPGHPFRYSVDDVWSRARRVCRNGRAVTVPHPLHQLWHVCVHFAWSHALQWGTWRALRDSAALTQSPGFDWREFVDFARASRSATCCYWTLRLARRLAGANVSDDVLAALRPPRREPALALLERHFISTAFPTERRCPSIWLMRWLWEAGVAPAWSGHGGVRPWRGSAVSWTNAEEREPEQFLRFPAWRRVRNAIACLPYLRRIHRLALPRPTMPTGTTGEPL